MWQYYIKRNFHSSKINIQRNIKDAYLTVSLIFSAIIIPKWNYIIGGWDNNPLYIPNVTKIFLLSTILLLLLIQIFNRLFSRSTIETYFSKILKFRQKLQNFAKIVKFLKNHEFH